jgi:hypothetical protein
MTENMMTELSRLQRYASALQGLLQEAQAWSPDGAQGTDGSGAVSMTVGADGLPVSVRVSSDWNRRIRPDAFAAAVVEASRAAQGEWAASWIDALEREGWQAKADGLRVSLDGPTGTSGPPPPAPRPDLAGLRPRPLNVLAEDALKEFGTVEKLLPQSLAAAQGTGRSAGGRFVLVLSRGGIVSCSADPAWVSQQTPGMLANAFADALAAARDALARAPDAAFQQAADAAGQLTGLFTEAIALLSEPRRLTES